MSIDIDAILGRANAATPGPWGIMALHDLLRFGRKNGGGWDQYNETMPVDGDEEFIISARQDVPALCAEVRELRAALERARALLVKLRDGIDDYWVFCNPEIIADLSAFLSAASGGAA